MMEETIITKILTLLKGITVSEAIKILFEVRREINDQTTIRGTNVRHTKQRNTKK